VQRGFSRRRFLRATAGLAAVSLAARWGGRLWAPGAVAQTGQVVLVEDLRLGAGELAAGSFAGASLRAGRLALGGSSSAEYVSPELRASFPATHAGVHWLGSASEGLSFWIRGSSDGVKWSDWYGVHPEAGHGRAASAETFAALVRLDKAAYLQFRVRSRETQEATIESVTVTALNSEDGPLASALAQALAQVAAAPSSKPLTYSREAWGANEALRFASGNEIWPRDYVPTKKVVIHHTATGNGYSTVAQAQADVRAVYTYHAVTQGWGDIGYCWLVDKFGNSYEGRRGRDGPGYDGPGGRELVSEGVVAGHATSYNHGSSGVAMLGSYDSAGPPSAAVAKLKDILAWECSRHGINPQASSDFLKANDSWHRGLPDIVGHRDTFATACPGTAMYALIPGLRSDTAVRLANSAAPAVSITSAPAQGTQTDRNVSYGWQGSGGSGTRQYSYYLEGWSLDSDVLVVYKSGFNPAREPAWRGWTTATQVSFTLYEPGHYTFHVRAMDSLGRVSVYEDSRTLLADVTPIQPPPPVPLGTPQGFIPGVGRD